jgi:trk system potassium uptake protein TrkA
MKFCVIGVGRFGYQVATTLHDHGMEVLAVDSSDSIIASIRDKVTHAICMRVSDEAALRSIGVEEMDTVIVAMGENFAESILVTALLKQRLQVLQVITRSISEIHKEILKLVGADHVVLPEQEMGIRLADQLSLPFNALMRITSTFSISQIVAPRRWVGKSIQELELPESYQVICLGRKIEDEVILLGQDSIVHEGEQLLLSGHNKDLERVAKLPH